jgi:hypothetical protein
MSTLKKSGSRGAPTFMGAPCRRCGNRERYMSRHCVTCGKVRVRELTAESPAAPGTMEETERTSMDAKLEAAGRCKCGLLNPCYSCPRNAAEYADARPGAGATYPGSP